VFSCNLFVLIQSGTSSRQVDTGQGRLELSDRPRVTGALDLRVISIQVRSKTVTLDEVMRSINPAVYKMKRRGPRTDPCGTPNQTVVRVDLDKTSSSPFANSLLA